MSTNNPKQVIIRALIGKGISTQAADVSANVLFDFMRQMRERVILEDGRNVSVRKVGSIIGLSKSAVDKIRHSKKKQVKATRATTRN